MNAKHLLSACLTVAAVLSLAGPTRLPAQPKDDAVGAEVVRPAADEVAVPARPAPGLISASPDAGRGLAAEIELRQVIWEKAKASAKESLDKAKLVLAKTGPHEVELSDDDFANARKLVAEAEDTLQKNENVAVPAELAGLRKQIADAKVYISDLEQRVDIARASASQRAAQDEARHRAAEVARMQRQRVDELMNQVDKARMENNYQTMRRLLEEVIKIDPTNRTAKWMLEDTRLTIQIQGQAGIDKRKGEEERDTLNNIREAMTPYDNPLVYPAADVWHELVERRKEFAAGLPPESPANQRVREQLDKSVPEIRFTTPVGFEAALNFLRELKQVNINPNWAAMEAVGITKNTEITLQLRDVTFETALREILTKAAGREGVLDFMIRDGVIKVSTIDDLSSLKYILVYDVRDLLHPLTDFRVPAVSREIQTSSSNSTQVGGAGGGGGGGASGQSLFGGASSSSGQEPGVTEQDRIAKAAYFLEILRTSVLPDTWSPTGDANMKESDGLLIVKQTANGHRELGKLLGQLREHSRMQITVEARFLILESDFLEDIGFDLNFIFNVGGGPGHRATAIPVNVGTFNSGGQPNPVTGQFVDLTGTSTLQPVGSGGIFTLNRPSLVTAGSFFDDLETDFFLQATQAHQQSTQLNGLRVTVMNGHEAYVLVETQTDYVSGLTAAVASGSAAFTPTTSQLINGESFGVRATVTADRKYVIMTVYPTLRDDSLAGTYQFQSSATSTSSVVSTGITPITTTPSASIQLAKAAIQEVRTTVMVPDKGTLVLGGQRLANELEVETGVPILSKIPIVKRAFTFRSYVKQEKTLLILIRPQILIPEELEP